MTKIKTKAQHFHPKDKRVVELALKHSGTRPNPEDIKGMAVDTIADAGVYLPDEKQRKKITAEAIETFKEIGKKEKK